MSGSSRGDGDWAWGTSTETGYQYPEDAHAPENRRNTPPPRPPGRWPLGPFTTAMIAGTIATAAVLATAMLTAPGSTPPAAATATTAAAAAIAATLEPTGIADADQFADLGNWLVGYGENQLPPGTYTIAVTSTSGGYWARCATEACGLGGLAGMLDNRFIPAGTAPADIAPLVIASTDYMVRHAGIALVPA